ncbi:unnamed protein product [Staurois parvus]|uniref:DUF1279 domain-containing protein n=1 Tax=Staurois parvus TaxID=386267 RepID=A0ABN9CYF3_9NEOB|nr:unnamed protein product [Staurois parvus]
MSALLLIPVRTCRGWALRCSRVLCVGGGRMQCVGKVGDMRPTPENSAYTGRSPARLSSQGPTEPATKETSGAAADGGGEKPSKTQQLKRIFKEYGGVAVAFHVGISLVSLGIFYGLVSSGLDVPARSSLKSASVKLWSNPRWRRERVPSCWRTPSINCSLRCGSASPWCPSLSWSGTSGEPDSSSRLPLVLSGVPTRTRLLRLLPRGPGTWRCP